MDAPRSATPRLTDDQKRFLYHHGCIPLRGIVPDQMIRKVREATALFETDLGDFMMRYGTQYLHRIPAVLDLLNRSALTPILREVMGEFDPPVCAQYSPTPLTDPTRMNDYTILGYRNRELPYRGSSLHVDSVAVSNALLQKVQSGSEQEIYERWRASGPKGDVGRSAEMIGHNQIPLFMDPDMTLGLSSSTCFICIACSDQTAEGVGQTMVVPGGHHAMERFFNWQAEHGTGCIGPEGLGWPRLDYEAPNRCGHVYLPPKVCRELLAEDPRTPACTSDGKPWVIPTPVNLHAGDALLCVHGLPHSMSRNDNGVETRKQVIFRLRNKRQQPQVVCNGLTSCPDRAIGGGWIKFEDGNDPFARAKHHLKNQWDNWEGMQDIVAQEKLRPPLGAKELLERKKDAWSQLSRAPQSAL